MSTPTVSPPDAAAAGQPSAAFQALMRRLDELQPLRYSDPERALQLIAQAHEGWPALDQAERTLLQARLAMQQGGTLTVLGRHQEALPALERMAALLVHPALQSATGALSQQARRCAVAGANARAVLAQALGDMPGALRAYLQALDMARSLADARYQAHVLVNLANTCQESGLSAEALEHLREALPLAQAQGMDELLGDIHHNMGNALADVGERDAGLASNQRALAQYAALALTQKQRYALVAVAERLLELGRADEAQAALAQRETWPQDFTNQQYEAYAAYLRGRIAVLQGRRDAARQALDEARRISAGLDDPLGQARALLECARLEAASSQPQAAATAAREALALLQPAQAWRDLMQAHECLHRLARDQGDLAAALAHHEQFHDAYARCINAESATKARLLAVRHEVDLVRAEARHAQLENARLSEALATISARLAGTPVGSVAADQPAQPADLQALGLTPREAEVLYWVAMGKTNEDVATILGASLSTVKKHLLRVFDKLGVENRTAAAGVARRPVLNPRAAFSGDSRAP